MRIADALRQRVTGGGIILRNCPSEEGKVLRNPRPNGGKDFENLSTYGSLAFENRQDRKGFLPRIIAPYVVMLLATWGETMGPQSDLGLALITDCALFKAHSQIRQMFAVNKQRI